MLMILHKVNTKDSFEVSWIYDRGLDGYFLKVENAKGRVRVGDQVVLSCYDPKLDKKIITSITLIETNGFNNNICVTLKNKKDIPYFKKSLSNLVK